MSQNDNNMFVSSAPSAPFDPTPTPVSSLYPSQVSEPFPDTPQEKPTNNLPQVVAHHDDTPAEPMPSPQQPDMTGDGESTTRTRSESGFQKLGEAIKKSTPGTQQTIRDVMDYSERSGLNQKFASALAKLSQASKDTKKFLDDKGVTAKAGSLMTQLQEKVNESGLKEKVSEAGKKAQEQISVVGKSIEVHSERAASYLAEKLQTSTPKREVSVVVPPNMHEGDMFLVDIGQPNQIEVRVPPGVQPGETMVVEY